MAGRRQGTGSCQRIECRIMRMRGGCDRLERSLSNGQRWVDVVMSGMIRGCAQSHREEVQPGATREGELVVEDRGVIAVVTVVLGELYRGRSDLLSD